MIRGGLSIKRLSDGRAMLNVGCGARSHPQWNNVDFSPYTRLARNRAAARLLRLVGVLSRDRYDRLMREVDPDIVRWNALRGLPYAEGVFDVVYHSHFLEHVDRSAVPYLLRECHRVLRPGGTIRVVVPDLEQIVERYVTALAGLRAGQQLAFPEHQQAVEDLFEQMVRRNSYGTSRQPRVIQVIERLVRGDAVATGEAHRWMYDRFSLATVLESVGFEDFSVESPTTGRIAGWQSFCLDADPSGPAWKPGSLYGEGTKPGGRRD